MMMKSVRDPRWVFLFGVRVLFGAIFVFASGGCEPPEPIEPSPPASQLQWSNDQTVCRDPNGFGGSKNSYPQVNVSQIVARDDESVFGVGTYKLPSQGLSSQYGYYTGAGGEANLEGPHPFKFDVASGGASASWLAIGFTSWIIQYPLKACGSGPWTGRLVVGPFIEPVGGDVLFYRQDKDFYLCADTRNYTCKFGDFSKYAAPQWSQGTTEVCAHEVFAFTGDAAGNVVTCEDDRLKKYDPSGAVVFDVPTPFDFAPTTLGLSAMGDIYAAFRSLTEVRLARADPSGTLVWTKTLPNPVPYYPVPPPIDLAVDASGNSIINVTANDPIDVGTGPLPPVGKTDIVLAKFDIQGNALWTKRMGGGEILISSMRKTGQDEIALVAHFKGSIDMGNGLLTTSPILVKYDTNGDLVWRTDLLSLYPAPSPEVLSVAIGGHPSGAVFVAGTGYGLASSTPDPNCDLGAEFLPGTYPRPLRMFTAKYGP